MIYLGNTRKLLGNVLEIIRKINILLRWKNILNVNILLFDHFTWRKKLINYKLPKNHVWTKISYLLNNLISDLQNFT